MFQLPGFSFVSVSFLSYKCSLGRNLKMAGNCLAILPLSLSLSPFMKYELMLLSLPKNDNCFMSIFWQTAWARKSPTQQMNEFMRIVCGVSNRKKTEVDNQIPDLDLSNGVKKKKHQQTCCQANRTYTPTTKPKYNLNHTA
jgi:hypothetical protein